MSLPSTRSVVLVAAALLLAAGCDDPFAPEPTPIPGPRAFVLHDFRTGPLTEPSAFDLLSSSPVRTDQSEGWDVLFVFTEDGAPQLHPRSVVIGGSSQAGLQEVSSSFADLLEVPGEGYTTDSPVDVGGGEVYALRSRRAGGCSRYAKMEVDSLDAGTGRLFATAVVNLNCNDRSVEPDVEEDGDGGDGQG